MERVDVIAVRQPGDRPSERGMKTRRAAQRMHRNAQRRQLVRPLARRVKAADHASNPGGEATADLDDETLGAARRQGEHDLHDAKAVGHWL